MQATPQRQVLRNRRIANGLLAAAVVAGPAYAVPPAAATPPLAADPPPAAASDPAHHLSPRLALIASDGPTGSRPAGDSQLSLTTSGPGSLLRTPSGRVVVDVRLDSRDAAAVEAI